jgi:hypothetical protein
VELAPHQPRQALEGLRRELVALAQEPLGLGKQRLAARGEAALDGGPVDAEERGDARSLQSVDDLQAQEVALLVA